MLSSAESDEPIRPTAILITLSDQNFTGGRQPNHGDSIANPLPYIEIQDFRKCGFHWGGVICYKVNVARQPTHSDFDNS